ncbi:thioredoxin domain-containing protein [Hyalangium gracile]|uniref:RedB protein n=1 Tax=Hyalangium gracile TaxID=394092 RepID=UPI001CCFF3A6|nr:RedB protein [Hyalangium gracile]
MKGRLPAGRGSRVLAATGVLWLAAVLGGMTALARYSTTPGEPPEAPSRWPADSALRPTPGRFLLVMLAHPRCPCSRASMGELEAVMARAGGRVDAYVLFLRPEGEGADWKQGELWRRAASIPGVTAQEDFGGVEARRLGATTSGHVLLYDAEGRLRFSGGITRSRGHAGDNAGRASLEALLLEGAEGEGQHPVYGCALRGPTERDEAGAPP